MKKLNVEIAEELGILDDLKENNSEEAINMMTSDEILEAWLLWEGIIGYTDQIISIYDSFKDNENEEE